MKLLDFFPFETPRPLQIKALDLIQNAYESGKKVVILEAPTGMGKSACALAVAKMYGPSHMITTQKILQDQYVRDFEKELFLMKGKSNYWCDIRDMQCGSRRCTPPETKCGVLTVNRMVTDEMLRATGVSSIGNKTFSMNIRETEDPMIHEFCSGPKRFLMKGCEYKRNYVASRLADVTLHNFHSFIFQGIMAGSHHSRPMLVMDEAHNIENIIMSFFEINISNLLFGLGPFPVFNDVNDVRKFFTEEEFCDEARHMLAGFGYKLEDKLSAIQEREEDDPIDTGSARCTRLAYLAIMESIHRSGNNEDSFKEAERYKHLIMKITILNQYVKEGEDFVFELTNNKDRSQSLTVKPVYIRFWTPRLFGMGDRMFLTSATIDKSQVCRNTGLDPDTVELISMPSEFPKENRPIYVINKDTVGALTKVSLAANLPKAILFTKKIISSDMYKNVKGIIHSHSDYITQYIKESLGATNKRFLFAKDFRNREEMLAFHHSAKNTIIVAPAMHEGLDLYDDLSRLQIIIKVPYPGIDIQIKRRLEKYHEWDWYNYNTILKMVQSYGRSVRHKEDWAHTYILDASFYNIYTKYHRYMPYWFQEALIFEK